MNCRKCVVQLNENNSYKSSIRKKDLICKNCVSSQAKSYYTNNKSKIDFKQKQVSKQKLLAKNSRYKASMRLGQHKYFDKCRGLGTCNINLKEYLQITNSPCFYCEDVIEQRGLDRIDNTKGHTINNVISCCISCNTSRMNKFSHEEMKIIGESIKKIKELRIVRINI